MDGIPLKTTLACQNSPPNQNLSVRIKTVCSVSMTATYSKYSNYIDQIVIVTVVLWTVAILLTLSLPQWHQQ